VSFVYFVGVFCIYIFLGLRPSALLIKFTLLIKKKKVYSGWCKVAGVVQWPSEKKKKQCWCGCLCCWTVDLWSSFDYVVTIFGVAEVFCLFWQVSVSSGETLTTVHFDFSVVFRLGFCVFSMFCQLLACSVYLRRVSAISGKSPACLRQVSNDDFFFPVVFLQGNSLVDHVKCDRCC
jgi:hypothetical protein